MNIIGIDQSLTDTGVVVMDLKGGIIHQQSIKTTPKPEHPILRAIFIKNKLRDIISKFEIGQGIMEGYGFGARGNALFQLGELGGLVRELFVEVDIPLLIIAPPTLKKYVSGKGNCKKDLMLLMIYKKWGIEFNNDNIADAYGLAKLALDMYTFKKSGELKFLVEHNIEKKLMEDHLHQIMN